MQISRYRRPLTRYAVAALAATSLVAAVPAADAAAKPKIAVTSRPSGDQATRSAAVRFRVTGTTTLISCKLDAKRATTCRNAWAAKGLAPGRHTLVITAKGPGGTVRTVLAWRTLTKTIYWGAWVDGKVYNRVNPPWDMASLNSFEQHAGKRASILFFGWPWYVKGKANTFQPALMDKVRARGTIPMLDWSSWDTNRGGNPDQPTFSLDRIIGGQHDAYIRAFAKAAKAWGHPFMIRFDHEMNGAWYPWSEQKNGNSAGDYVKAWRHVHDIFVAEGATNVSWIWCVNIEFPGSQSIPGLYPGDSYVDWVAVDGYNWSKNPVHDNVWRTFTTLYKGTLRKVAQLAPKKPIMIAEIASNEGGGSKAAWIKDVFTHQLIDLYPRVGAVVWFNWGSTAGLRWPIESSTASQNAFRAAIRSPYYAANSFGNLPFGPIKALPNTR